MHYVCAVETVMVVDLNSFDGTENTFHLVSWGIWCSHLSTLIYYNQKIHLWCCCFYPPLNMLLFVIFLEKKIII